MARGVVPAQADVQQAYVPFIGGTDTSSNRLAVQPGLVFGSMNYVARVTGGYRRIGGYERFDGRGRPSDATYRGMDAATTWSCAVGASITGATSGATGVVCYKNTAGTWIAVTDITGTFSPGETVNVGGAPAGVYTADTAQIDGFTQNLILYAAAEVYRARIQQVPGSGPLRGVAELAGTVYAWRDNLAGTATDVYKSTAAGWVQVPLYYELSFSGASAEPAEGTVVTKGGVSATVKRVVLESGAYVGGTAAGRLIITQPTGGSFTTGAFTSGMTGNVASSYLGTAITLQPGGSYAFDKGVFSAGTMRLYGCDGVNREFEFDGSVLVPLSTGVANVRATCVKVHAKSLWYSFAHAVQHSAIAYPYQWTALTGAAEIDVNATVTNLLSVGGNDAATSLMIFSERGVHVLYGTSDLNYNLTLLSEETGADKWSAQPMQDGISCSRNGIRISNATQHFDNFSYELASQRIDGYTAQRRATCSAIQRSRSMYMLFFDDGTGLTGVPAAGAMQWMPINLGFTVTHAWSSEVAGVERIFVTSDSSTSAYVYEIEVGRSFDGQAVEAWALMHPFTAKAPAVRKTYRNVTLEATGESPFTIYLNAEFNYGNPDDMLTPQSSLSMNAQSMRWDVSKWDRANWDGKYADSLRFETRGGAAAMGLNLYSNSATELPHVVQGGTFFYTVRRMQR